MRGKGICCWAVGLLLVLASGLFVVGCFGSSSGSATTTASVIGGVPTSVATGTTLAGPASTGENAALSTFKSKDPFIQQAQPVTSTTPTTGGGSTVTTIKGSTTTSRPSSSSTTSGGSGGSTTSTTGGGGSSSTSTTAAHLHTLRVLSIGQTGGSPVVTFQVDGTIYQNKHAGDVVSSNWGQIKVLEINVSSRIVTLLHGSETLVLSQGQVVYQ